MVEYKCLFCGKVVEEEHIERRIHCPYCGKKVLYKPQVVTTHWKAR